MATELNANGISFGDPIYNQSGTDTAANTYQRSATAVVKIGFGSASTLDQTFSGGDGTEAMINGTEINMGVPSAADNLYRIWYQTVTDDNDSNVSGFGIRMYRHTPSAGWQELLSQGSHASYDNNMGDWYRTNNSIFWIPVHPNYPSEVHSFRLYGHKHDSGSVRINSSIGGDQRRNGWNNNTFEIWEINRDLVHTTGRFSTNF
jgi:hypothetical protein